jgi:LCP family protein required for cell wall assembly
LDTSEGLIVEEGKLTVDLRLFHKISSHLWQLIVLVSLGVIITGCIFSAVAGMPVAAYPLGLAAQATYVLAPPDATATPTPFQPLAPTAALGENPLAQLATQFVPLPTIQPTEPPPQATGSGPTPTITPTGAPPPAVNLTAEPSLEKLPRQINLLLLGSDRRPNEAGFRTDTILLLTINSDLGSVNVTSFPRDLWVNLPNWGDNRINTAFTYGGYRMLKDTFQHDFGITVDYFALIDFGAFKHIVDQLGGLNVNVAESVSDYRNGYWETIKPGMQKMDADTVLWYVRTRKTTNDIKRNQRQREVLTALLEKFISIDAIRRAPEFFDLYNNTVKTDLDMVTMLKWLPFAAKIAETRNIHYYAITYNQVYDWVTPEGAMVLVPKQAALMKVIRQSQNLQ